jgi:hypothetical protein
MGARFIPKNKYTQAGAPTAGEGARPGHDTKQTPKQSLCPDLQVSKSEGVGWKGGAKGQKQRKK